MGLTKRKDSYYVEFPVLDDGKTLTLARGVAGAKLKRWKTGTTNRTMAKQQETLIKTDLMKGIVKSDMAVKCPTFAEWAYTYLGLEEVRSLSTYQDRVESVRLQLIPFFGKKSLAEITPADIEAFRAQRKLRNGKVPTVSTVNADHAFLKHILSVAERHGLIATNAAKKVPLPSPNNERDRVLTQDEWNRLYAAAVQHLRPILLVAYHLGLRLGEILRLTWDKVDLARGFLKLRAEDTKTKEARLVPLTPEVRSALADLSKVRRLDTSRVFLYQGKSVQEIKKAFKRAVLAAGIENLRFHDLRHCAATNLRRAGVDTMTAMRIIGHKSEKMHRRYNSVEESDLARAAAKLHTYISNTLITPARGAQEGGAVSG
ncbi:tyrosine-type recombinase/integrase [Nitrospiraceae bacterium AH_259_D15_M11_P09]|nr:tyrosine-type recombinase/integrase [Nitrospiraceae bacterium AH_259_D15_M11_P09]